MAKNEGKLIDEIDNGASYVSRGKYLGQVLDDLDIQKIKSFLSKYNVDFQIGKQDGIVEVSGYYYPSGNTVKLEANQAAMFITDGKSMKLVLRENATLYEAFHELMHFKECKEMGKKAFLKKSLVEREKYVYNKMVKYSKYLNRKEIRHAEDYINWHYYDARLTDKAGNPLKEILPINLLEIPKKRKGVNIDKILKII